MPESISASTLPPSDDLVWHYRRLWDEGSLPDLASFLAGKDDVSTATLVEVLDIDQWNRWAAGQRVRAEQYLATYPRLWDDPEQALRLVYGEFLLRERRGEAPEAVDFAARFPALAGRLAQQIELHRALAEPENARPEERVTMEHLGGPAPGPPGAPSVPGFEILAEVGRGGMGVVYQARQEKLRRTVALKFLTGGGQHCPETLLRFRREAESAARLQHPNIVQIYEVGEAGDRPYIVMEFVAGGSLADRLDGTPRPPGWSAELIQTLSRAVHFAHQGGIVHRDLKPANVLLSVVPPLRGGPAEPPAERRDYSPKIADFGLAKQLDAQQGQTGTNLIVGTPAYMAPEQAAGGSKAVGPAADVWALGVILYECLTGRPPFQGADLIESLQQVRYQEPVAPSRLRPGLPRDLETICLKCLEKYPVRRYSSAAALADDLERFRDGRPILARPASSVEHAWKWAKRRPAVALLSAATALATLVGVALYSVAMAKYAAERDERGRAEGLLLGEQTRSAEAEWNSYVSGLARAQRLWASDVAGESLLVPGLLSALPEGKRGWEWALYQKPRREAWGRIRETRSPINSVAYTPDGRLLAIGAGQMRGEGGQPRAVQVWDLVAKKQLPPLEGHTDPVNCVAFSPDGELLAAASEWYDEEKFTRGDLKAPDGGRGRVLVWKLATGRVVHDLGEAFRTARFSGDGRRFFAACPKRVARVWDSSALPWRELPPLPERTGHVHSVVPSPDGKRLVALTLNLLAVKPGDIRTPGTAQVWDVDAARLLFRLDHPGIVYAAAYSADGKRLVTGGQDGGVRIWDANTGQLLQTSWGHTGGLRAVAFSRDGSRVASAGVDESVVLWDARTGREVASYRGHGDAIQTVAFDPAAPPGAERLASGDKDGYTRLWDVTRRQQPRELLGHSLSVITDLAFSADGAVLVSACQGEARVIVWDMAKGEPRHRLEAPAEKVAVAGPLVATAGGYKVGVPGELKLWSGGKLVRRLDGHPDYVLCAAFSPDGRLLLSASGNTHDVVPGLVKLHDAASGEEKASFRPDGGVVAAAAWHPDGERVALACLGKVAIVCRRDGGEPRRFVGLEEQLSSVAFSPDGKLLACGDRAGNVAIWDAERGELLRRMPGHRSMVTKLSFHPSGKRLASASAGLRPSGGTVDLRPAFADVRLWDVPTGREVLVMPASHAAAFGPDGHKLAVVGREVDLFTPGRIEVWDASPLPDKP